MLPCFSFKKEGESLPKKAVSKLHCEVPVMFSSPFNHMCNSRRKTHISSKNYHSNPANGRFHPQPMIKKVDLKMCPYVSDRNLITLPHTYYAVFAGRVGGQHPPMMKDISWNHVPMTWHLHQGQLLNSETIMVLGSKEYHGQQKGCPKGWQKVIFNVFHSSSVQGII